MRRSLVRLAVGAWALAFAFSVRAADPALAGLQCHAFSEFLRPGNLLARDARRYPPLAGFRPTIREDEPRVLRGQSYVLITHASRSFDGALQTVLGLRELLAFARPAGLPTIGVIERAASGYSFFAQHEVSEVMESTSGAHSLRFPNAREFIFAGALLSECLGETIRDAIRGSEPTALLRMYLASDATIDAFPHVIPSMTTLMSFARAPETTDERLYAYLKGLLLAERGVFGAQLAGGYEPLDFRPFRFRLFRGARPLGPDIGDGPRTIELVIAPVRDLAGLRRGASLLRARMSGGV